METKPGAVTQASLTAEEREARAAEARRALTGARDAVEKARTERRAKAQAVVEEARQKRAQTSPDAQE